jgi:hypothetical protein
MRQETVNLICIAVLIVCVVGTLLVPSYTPPYQ